jgi:hypothetical protein
VGGGGGGDSLTASVGGGGGLFCDCAGMQLPFWQVPSEQGVPSSFGLHFPALQTFLPFFFSQSPFSHFSHSSQSFLHLPDSAARTA